MPQNLRRLALALLGCLLAAGLLAPAGASARSKRAIEGSPSATSVRQERAVRREEREARRARRRQIASGQLEATAPGEAAAPTPPTVTETVPPGEPSPPEEKLRSPRRNERARMGREGCSVSIEAATSGLIAGESVTLHGKLSCPAGASVAGEAITVSARRHGAGPSALADVGATKTAEDGSYQLIAPSVQANTTFIVRTPLALGARTIVRVTPMLTLTARPMTAPLSTRSASSPARNGVAFSGKVSPLSTRDVGTRVTLQREYAGSGEKWHAIAFGHIAADGSFAFVHGFRYPGEVSVRVVTRLNGDAPTASEPITFEISQAQNPRLTIQASADPVAPGQPLTITGVAAEGASKPVTLLGRTPGHGFAVLAKASTDEHGAYTFAVSPSQSTSYRVIDAADASTPLFEGVRYLLTLATTPTSASLQAPIEITGTVASAPLGHAVYLERGSAAGFGFHVVAKGSVDQSAGYSIAYSFPAAGSYTLRVRVPGDANALDSTSPQFSVTVTRTPGASTESEETVAPPGP